MGAIARRHERESRRELRELIKAQKEAQKLDEQEAAAAEVRRYEVMILVMTTVHRECGPAIDWRALASWTAPPPPDPRHHTAPAEDALASYRPGLLARLFGGANKMRTGMEQAIAAARVEDTRARALYDEACAEATEARTIAHSVLGGDTRSYSTALDCVEAFDELKEYGVAIDVVALANMTNAIRLDLAVEERKVVPEEEKSLTKAGKLSSKKMPKTRGNDFYQDYVCGAALRACREAFAALSPLEWILVTVRADILNTKTGHVEPTPVLSAMIPRTTVDRLNWGGVDASDAVSNFVNRMNFKKGAGMAAIAPLTTDDLAKTLSGAASP